MTALMDGKEAKTFVASKFEADDLGAPFKVILHNAVTISVDPASGEVLSYKIPDLDGLLAEIVLTRVLHPLKLRGVDVKYLRKVLGLKQKEFAEKIEVTVETLSRYETGVQTISPSSEKLMRIFSLKSAAKLHKVKSCDAKAAVEDILDTLFDKLKPVSVIEAGEDLRFNFYRKGKDAETSEMGGHWEKAA